MNEINEVGTLRWHLKILVDGYLKTDGWKRGDHSYGRGYNNGAIDVAERLNELLENKYLK